MFPNLTDSAEILSALRKRYWYAPPIVRSSPIPARTTYIIMIIPRLLRVPRRIRPNSPAP